MKRGLLLVLTVATLSFGSAALLSCWGADQIQFDTLPVSLPAAKPSLPSSSSSKSLSPKTVVSPKRNPNLPTSTAIKPLEATITESRFLPAQMYGQWNVTGQLIETNAPGIFVAVTNDIWLLEETDSQVTISNPATGASATISVDEVRGNTATFHRTVFEPERGRKTTETPTVTVQEDTLSGVTVDTLELIRNGVTRQALYGKYQLTATRIAGPKVRFSRPAYRDPQFVIEAVQHER